MFPLPVRERTMCSMRRNAIRKATGRWGLLAEVRHRVRVMLREVQRRVYHVAQ